jgi:hypothetical protein
VFSRDLCEKHETENFPLIIIYIEHLDSRLVVALRRRINPRVCLLLCSEPHYAHSHGGS